MLKVRDQDLCRTGSVLFVRQPCGRYDERESEQQVMAEMQGKVLDKDRLPWIELLKRKRDENATPPPLTKRGVRTFVLKNHAKVGILGAGIKCLVVFPGGYS